MSISLYYSISSTVRAVNLTLNKLSEQSKHHIKDSLVMTFSIIAQFVRYSCKGRYSKAPKNSEIHNGPHH